MNNIDLNTQEMLDAMRILEGNSASTQRDLSQQMNLSLGKINFLMRSMIERGLVKAKRFTNSNNKRAYLYLLTPKGLEHKIVLTRNFLKRKMNEYDRLEHEIKQLQESLNALTIFDQHHKERQSHVE